MSFHDESLPPTFEYGSVFGAGGFETIVQTTASGHEYRLARQAQARHRYRLRRMLQTQAEAVALKTFALSRRGALHSFRLKDWADYTSNDDGSTAPTNLDQVIGVGDGTETRFQLIKVYDETGLEPYVRTIELPVAGSVVVAVNGVPATFTVTNPGGLITITGAPLNGQLVTAGFQFDVPVRFDGSYDKFTAMQTDAFGVWTMEDLQCVEVLREIAWPEMWNPGGCKVHTAAALDVTIAYAEGLLHSFGPTASHNVYLPPTVGVVGGPRHFVIHNRTGSVGSLQLRDDAGVAVGSAIAAGVTKQVGLAAGGGSFAWVVY